MLLACEPKIALYAKNNGLEYYEKILKNASKVINNRFLIAFEIGQTQGKAIEEMAKKYVKNANVDILKDLSLKDRMLFVYNY